MMIDNGNGTFTAGEADIICILKLPTNTYHVAFFEEHPFAGQVKPIKEEPMLRLKSKMHHTKGSLTLEGAQVHLDDMRTKLIVLDSNVIRDRAIEVQDPVNVWVVPNWIKENKQLAEVLQLRGSINETF
jgi:hypothetical protein